MKVQSRTPSESLTEMSQLVMPNDTNPYHNLMGGRLMYMMDIAAAICAQRHANNIVVTASVDNVSFRHPIKLGNVVTIKAKLTRAFKTSMEVRIEAWDENYCAGEVIKSNEAFFTFVALGEDGRPVPVPELVPETSEEKQLYDTAMTRRELRLILAEKMRPENATGLKSIFFPEMG